MRITESHLRGMIRKVLLREQDGAGEVTLSPEEAARQEAEAAAIAELGPQPEMYSLYPEEPAFDPIAVRRKQVMMELQKELNVKQTGLYDIETEKAWDAFVMGKSSKYVSWETKGTRIMHRLEDDVVYLIGRGGLHPGLYTGPDPIDIAKSWPTSGPRITSVLGKNVRYRPNIKGMLDFIRDYKAAGVALSADTRSTADALVKFIQRLNPNVLIKNNPGEAAEINAALGRTFDFFIKGASGPEALEVIAEACGLKVEFEGNAAIFSLATGAAARETEQPAVKAPGTRSTPTTSGGSSTGKPLPDEKVGGKRLSAMQDRFYIYDQYFKDAADRAGLPFAFVKAVGVRESALDPSATSNKGAKGIMQFMPGTAEDMGLDDPRDPATSIDAGARYLRKKLDRHGSYELALAAYNAGSGNVQKAGGIPQNGETPVYVEDVMELFDFIKGWQPEY